jgi:hypothetical protein
MTDFIQWLAGLAAEGETALLVRQRGRGYIATLPRDYRPGGAWYGNTGSFIEERLKGRFSFTRDNIEHVLVLMLDDIGTKVTRTPPLPPTWRMETSPGNEQWGYAFKFDDQPTKAEFTAAMLAMAAAGWTDEGATNAVRNFRLPGSVNLKPGRDGFESRLVEFDPSREYSLPEICAALGVVPGAPSADVSSVIVDDGADDEVLGWLAAKGWLLERPNSAGWAGVVCPNADEHSNDDPEGRYFPASRAFKCLHGHCGAWDSVRFLDWVAEQGGPKVGYGLRDELVQAQMAAALERVAPTEAYPDDAAAVVAEADRREAGRVEKAGWFKRFAYLHADDGYFDLVERKEYSRANFNAIFRHVDCRSIHAMPGGKPRRIEASVSFDEHRQAMGARVLQGVTYAAGDGVLVSRAGDVYANLWRDGRPVGSSGDVSAWLAHAERMIPDAVEREHVLDWMAFKVQHPAIKVNHGVLHGGIPGSGKDTLWAPFLYAIGGAGKANVAIVKNEELTSQWGYALMSEVMVINELRQVEAADRRALENRLKPMLAAPPETLSVNRKGLHPVDILNRLAVIAFSNERVPIVLTGDDRRWFVIWSDAERMADRDATRLWDWYRDRGGFDAIAGWLRARDVARFSPGAAPMTTEAKAIMTQAALSPVEATLIEMMTERRGEFALGAAQGPWPQLCDRLAGHMPVGARCSVWALFRAFRDAGWLDLGRVKTVEHQTKAHVMCAPDVWARLGENRSEVRRLCERAKAGPGLRVV